MRTILLFNCVVITFFSLLSVYNCVPTSKSDRKSSAKQSSKTSSPPKQKLILILADGVRYDYINDPTLKGFKRMARTGVRAEYVRPIFPSNSYPNWYTIVTGKYAESHGMVQNFMYDFEKNDTFLMWPHSNASHPHWWEMAEPLWTTAEKQGVKTAVYWWDGCQIRIKNTEPTLCLEYQSFWTWPNVKNDTMEAIDEILDNFESDEWQLALIYYEAVDATGHAFGPESSDRVEAMRDLDEILYHLQEQIESRNLSETVNTVVVSDHGMLMVETENDANKTKIISIEKIIDEHDVIVMLDRGATSMLIPVQGKESKILDDLKKANTSGLRFYDKPNIPTKYHFKNNQRVAPILLVADKGYFLEGFSSHGKTRPISDVLYPGHHGYDPYDVKEMRTIFYATGSRLKHGFVSKPLMMTDHYNLICFLLGIEAAPNNGSWNRVQDMVAESNAHVEYYSSRPACENVGIVFQSSISMIISMAIILILR
ncbi:glycerophosphocholine cholinephosphodiesterase ENPP6-like [Brevipalpus obovatus]|uniref:glycerophosphocholine cholinephosphodiesterase ENPP6-like n=1 Tax=Brevipalpus obovatus TaxID=246614 RepID=UPI003D9E8A37